jgi:hypothetical protein
MKTFIAIIQMIGYGLFIACIGSVLNKSFDLNLGLRGAGAFPKDYYIAAVFFVLGGICVGIAYFYNKKNPE